MNNCRYCNKLVSESERATTHSYWQGLPFICHKACKQEGEKEEAMDCQMIDADCNDCRHFERGPIVWRYLSCMDHGKPAKRMVNEGVTGRCLRFGLPTIAHPKTWTDHECFEHRRKHGNEVIR